MAIITQPSIPVKTAQNVAVAALGDFAQLNQFTFEMADTAFKVPGKIFLKEILHLTSAEISLNTLPPGQSVPFYHKHRQNEEIYIFVRGEGEFQVGDRVFPVSEGSVVRVDPDGERCWRNTSDTEMLCYVVIQSRINSYTGQTIEDGFGVEKRVSWVGKERL